MVVMRNKNIICHSCPEGLLCCYTASMEVAAESSVKPRGKSLYTGQVYGSISNQLENVYNPRSHYTLKSVQVKICGFNLISHLRTLMALGMEDFLNTVLVSIGTVTQVFSKWKFTHH